MRLYEFEGKSLLNDYGIPTPRFRVVETAGEAEEAASSVAGDDGEVVLKAQILSGGRMKAGGIVFASGSREAHVQAHHLLHTPVLGTVPERLLIEPKLPIEAELFIAVTYDPLAGRPVVLAGRHGGIDVEEKAALGEAGIVRLTVDPNRPLWSYRCREMAARLGCRGRDQQTVAAIIHRLYQLFWDCDATLAEINPLARTRDGRWLALDCHIDLDDEALYRQRPLQERFHLTHRSTGLRAPTPLEEKAAEIDALDHRGVAGRLIEFDGDVALLIGGGGASLTAFDAIRAAGGTPANYCEVGGNPSVRKVAALTRLLLEKPGVKHIAVIMNIVNNTRADLMARGVIKGVIEAGRDPAEAIAVFRIPGAWEEESERILRHFGVRYCDRTVSIDEAARMAVAAQSSPGGSGPVRPAESHRGKGA